MVVDVMVINPAEDFNISSALVEWRAKPLSILRHSARPSCEGSLSSYSKMVTLAMRRQG